MPALGKPHPQFEKVRELFQHYEIIIGETLQSSLDIGNRDQVLTELERLANHIATDINAMSKNPVHKDILLEANRTSTPQRVKLNIVQEAIRHLKETGEAGLDPRSYQAL